MILNIKKILSTVILLSVLSSCYKDVNNQTGEKEEIKRNKLPIKECASHSPPVRDPEKIKTMLKKENIITAEMTEQEVHKIVSNYIKNKYQANSSCNKDK